MSGQRVLALTGLAAEAEVVRRLDREPDPIRRVTDIVELLSVAQPVLSAEVLVSARFPQMNRDVAARIMRAGVSVRGLVDAGDDVGARTCQDWGVPVVSIGADSDISHLIAAAATTAAPGVPPDEPRVIAVTGPPGSTGRTTIAVNLAASWPGRTLVLDADVWAPGVGFQLGLPAGHPGIVGACRQAALGRLDGAALESAAAGTDVMKVLPGDVRSGHEVCATGIDGLLGAGGSTARTLIVDCGWGPVPAAAATEVRAAVLQRATVVVSVALPTALGIRRWLDAVSEVRDHDLVVVWNQVGRSRRRLAELVESAAAGARVAQLPWDSGAAAAMAARPGPLAEIAPRSRLRRGIARLAGDLAALPQLTG